ncbi:MAG TPA: hypothetical protein DD400_05560 [Rhodospirillaceae bacterium]|nr:hypothetical protein [Rhodospirillaceae bacterium]
MTDFKKDDGFEAPHFFPSFVSKGTEKRYTDVLMAVAKDNGFCSLSFRRIEQGGKKGALILFEGEEDFGAFETLFAREDIQNYIEPLVQPVRSAKSFENASKHEVRLG